MNLDENLKSVAKENHVPISRDETICYIIDIINKNNYKNILEIGTAIGFGSISMAENTRLNHIDSLEKDELTYNSAINNIKSKNLEDKITVFNIDAKDYLQDCKKQYDLIYLDGPKGQYINYLPFLLSMLAENGQIIADNIFFHGMVTGTIDVPVSCRSMIKGLHHFVDEITANPNLSSQILNLGDGVAVIKKR